MHSKNVIAIILLFLAGMPVFYSMYTLAEKRIIEYRMEEKLEKENLQTITLDASEGIWLKQDKEILINGEPFDIKKLTRKGNKITICGLYDLQEKELKGKLQAYHQQKDKSASTKNSLLLLLIFTTCYKINEPINLAAQLSINKEQSWQKCQDNIYMVYYEIITPPPRLV